MDGGDRGQLAGSAVELEEIVEIDGAQAVAVGEHEAAAANELSGLP